MNFNKNYPKEIFVYFLLKNKEVVYVGQTTNGLNRIKQHFKEQKKDFDDYKIIKCSKKDLNELESFYIIKYKPKYNKSLNSSIVKCTYIIFKIKDKIGFNPYSIKRIEEIIEKSPFEKYIFNNKKSIKKEYGNFIADFLIKKYIDENAEIDDYFEKIQKG